MRGYQYQDDILYNGGVAVSGLYSVMVQFISVIPLHDGFIIKNDDINYRNIRNYDPPIKMILAMTHLTNGTSS